MAGYIYVLQNPIISDYVKVGFTLDVEKSLDDINSSTDFPLPFQKVITYQIDTILSDEEVLHLFLLLKPSLIEDKFALKKFYLKIPINNIYFLLSRFAEISLTKNNLWYLYSDNQNVFKQTEPKSPNQPDLFSIHNSYLLSSYSVVFEKSTPIKLYFNDEDFDINGWLDMCYKICYELYSLNEDALSAVFDNQNPLIGKDLGNNKYKSDKSYQVLFDNYYIRCAGMNNVKNILDYIFQIVFDFDKLNHSNFIDTIRFEIF